MTGIPKLYQGVIMMMQNTFITETDEKYVSRESGKAAIIVFMAFSLFACFGFLIAWQTFIFFEGIVLLSCTVALFSMKRSNHNYELYFENDHLCITNRATGETFEVYDIPASDFIITQTKKEKTVNYCSLTIKKTVFAFGGIKNCLELKKYISENYK